MTDSEATAGAIEAIEALLGSMLNPPTIARAEARKKAHAALDSLRASRQERPPGDREAQELDVVRFEGTVLDMLGSTGKYALVEFSDDQGRGETVVMPLKYAEVIWAMPGGSEQPADHSDEPDWPMKYWPDVKVTGLGDVLSSDDS
jgi:hypothetical protein